MSVQLNTLFITTENASLYKDHETVVVKVDGEKRIQVPLLHLGSVVCLRPTYVSPDLMAACSESGVHVAFFSMAVDFWHASKGYPAATCCCGASNIASLMMPLSLCRSAPRWCLAR